MECSVWPVSYPCDVSTEDDTIVALATSSAQSILWGLSGRRYGVCETTESYRLPCNSPCYLPWFDDFGPGVEWRLTGGYPYRRRCCEIHLAQKPVRSINAVEVYGVLLDPSEYYLTNSGVLQRINECWPCDSECDVPPIEVTYTYGIDVPALGAMAMGELACEIIAGWTGGDCRLPSNAVSVTRQGITVDLGNAQTLFEQGRIGLPICDAFLRETNPGRLQQASGVYSPDLSRRRR
jgi:hypothetical protein